jgi:hypothetical protein
MKHASFLVFFGATKAAYQKINFQTKMCMVTLLEPELDKCCTIFSTYIPKHSDYFALMYTYKQSLPSFIFCYSSDLNLTFVINMPNNLKQNQN